MKTYIKLIQLDPRIKAAIYNDSDIATSMYGNIC